LYLKSCCLDKQLSESQKLVSTVRYISGKAYIVPANTTADLVYCAPNCAVQYSVARKNEAQFLNSVAVALASAAAAEVEQLVVSDIEDCA